MRQARILKENAALEWASALGAARDQGHSLSEIATQAGVSRQAVHSLTNAHPTDATTGNTQAC